MLFFRQMDWKEFSNQPHIKKLPLNEQMQQFSYHMQQMSNLNSFQPKGSSRRVVESSAVIGTGTGYDFFHDTLKTDGTPAQENGTNIQYSLDILFYRNGVQEATSYNFQPSAGETKPFVVSPNWVNGNGGNGFDEIRAILTRRNPDNTSFYNATFNIEASAGTLGTVELLTTPDKPIPYSIPSGTTVNGGSSWTWKITGFSIDFRALFTITEKP